MSSKTWKIKWLLIACWYDNKPWSSSEDTSSLSVLLPRSRSCLIGFACLLLCLLKRENSKNIRENSISYWIFTSQQTFTCSKSTIETLEKVV